MMKTRTNWKIGTHGFTSVEVLAATTLAASLMVAVLGVLAGIAKKERLLEKGDTEPAWHRVALRQITHDLRQAKTFRSEPGRIILTCYGLSDWSATSPAWYDAEIHYFAVKVNDRNYLARQVWPKDERGELGPAELICEGIDSFTLYPQATDPRQLSSQEELKPLSGGLMPARIRAELSLNGSRVLGQNLVLY